MPSILNRKLQIDTEKLIDLSYCIHKLNNMITIIQGNAELITLEEDSEEAEDILTCAQKCQEILKEMRKIHS